MTFTLTGWPAIRYRDARLDPVDNDAQPVIAAAGGALALRSGYIALQSEG